MGWNKGVNGGRDTSKNFKGNNIFDALYQVRSHKDIDNISNLFTQGTAARDTLKIWKRNKRPKSDRKKGLDNISLEKGNLPLPIDITRKTLQI